MEEVLRDKKTTSQRDKLKTLSLKNELLDFFKMIIDQTLLDTHSQQAKENPRLRQAFDLSTTPEDQSQRILNAVEPGTILPIHRHRGSTETIIVLRGKVVQHYYNDAGKKTASFELAPGSAQVGMSVPVGQWHALESLEEGSVIFE